MPDPAAHPAAHPAAKPRSRKKKRKPSAHLPPPPLEGDDNASSYKNLMERYVQAKARVEWLEGEVAGLKERLGSQTKALAERAGEADEGITAARMKKVLNQRPEADSGPLEDRIREWLSKDVKGFEAAIEEKERKSRGDAERDLELVALRGRCAELEKLSAPAGPDAGSERVLGLLDSWLADSSNWET